MASNPTNKILLPYQKRWIEDRAQKKIWLASRQIGKSFTLSLEAVDEASRTKCVNLILSASLRQSKEVMQKVYAHLRVLKALSPAIDTNNETKEEVELPNGSRIISLPASPDTVRGFSGNVFLDEFAFHGSPEDIWRAMYPTITRGYKIRVSSTAQGKNLFYRIWSEEGNGFSRHLTDIYMAKEQGLKVDIDELKKGCMDPDTWAQEFECQFLDEASAYITYDMITACENDAADMDLHLTERPMGEFYLGVDIGRKKDLTVFWLWEKLGDVFWTRMVRVLLNTSFRVQQDFLFHLMDGGFGPHVRRACVDATGIGAQMAEEARDNFGSRVEPVVFTGAVKEDLAVTMRRKFEDRRVRIPADRDIREDIHAVKKISTPAGNIRFDAERTELGHADRFWAAALGLHAGDGAPGPVVISSRRRREAHDIFRGY
jgi:phage FluMu gp28-like protein